MSVLDKALTHFSSKTVRELYVPEWECTVYAKNMCLEDKAKLLSRANGDNASYLVYSLIYGLQDSQGKEVFNIGDKPKLLKYVDPDIVAKVANFVLSAEESEKN
jgi:hypothetical protein